VIRKRATEIRTSVTEKNSTTSSLRRKKAALAAAAKAGAPPSATKSVKFQGKKSATTRAVATMVLTASEREKRARLRPEYSTSRPPAISVSASGVSKGMRPSSPGTTRSSVASRRSRPTKPMGPTTVQMGVAATAASEKGWRAPSCASFQAKAMTVAASGSS